ncbi:hypothetical protein [Shinella sp.]|uniref:hypothetical protein n=1 Tax=Shinella sp. TaxID=1870904 RepID=UPI003D27452B
MTTALAIAQAVVNELGLPPVDYITENTNTTVRQLVSLMNRSGDELYQAHQWTQRQKLHVVNIGNPITTTGDIVSGSDIISNVGNTTGVQANSWAITGDYLITSTRVVEVIDATTIRVDQPATQSQIGAQLIMAKDTYNIPEDFSWFLNRTMWDRTNRWELIGPISPQIDEYNRSGVVTTGPRRRWRQVGLPNTCWRLWPPPTASGSFPATLVFEYVSKYWAMNASGVEIANISRDDDQPLVDAQAIILATKWRLWQIKGFEYGPLQAEYLDYVQRLAARDGGAADLSLARPYQSPTLITPASVPDGNWPGVATP